MKPDRLKRLVSAVQALSNAQKILMENAVRVFSFPYEESRPTESIFDREGLEFFGNTLRLHHAFSEEAFTKDKFEHLFVAALNEQGNDSSLATRGNPGYDMISEGEKFSLKTQADKTLKKDKLHISKFMELGKGQWSDQDTDLIGLRDSFLEHLKDYDRIFSLRALRKSPDWHYELVEIPKDLFLEAENGEFEMKHSSIQNPKPGYCYVRDQSGQQIYSLYFDGGGERKLQIKHLLKSACFVHAEWKFHATELEESLF